MLYRNQPIHLPAGSVGRAQIRDRGLHHPQRHRDPQRLHQLPGRAGECLNTVLCKAEIPLSTDKAKQYPDNVLTPLFRVPASLLPYSRALDLRTRYRYGL